MYCYESAIDLLAHASLEGDFADKTRLSLGGVSDVALEKFISQNPSLTKITFCLDSDQTGAEATERLAQKYAQKGFEIGVIKPKLKDFGQDIQAFRKAESTKVEKSSGKVSEDKSESKSENSSKKSSELTQS
ncbi:hypothetical protein FACS1894132_07890 [Clostridia bacterium]|nr:hypothetical protein FACS1894132_07890 [Clostridia bacterium]